MLISVAVHTLLSSSVSLLDATSYGIDCCQITVDVSVTESDDSVILGFWVHGFLFF